MVPLGAAPAPVLMLVVSWLPSSYRSCLAFMVRSLVFFAKQKGMPVAARIVV